MKKALQYTSLIVLFSTVLFLSACASTDDEKTQESSVKKTESVPPPPVVKSEKELKKVIMSATEPFEYTGRLPRHKETALGNMIADSIVWSVAEDHTVIVDFALINGGTIRSGLPAEEISQKHFSTMLPHDNWIYLLTLKGSDVQSLFDYISSINQGESAFAQVSKEVRYTINYDKNGKNGIISDLTIRGAQIDEGKDYVIATTDYLAAGGDAYTAFKNALSSENTNSTLSEAVIEYARKLPQPVTPNNLLDQRIQIIGGINP